ncbi:PREDICTED: uncharacterized protein LOC107357303 isoform X3 [Acropora digitifera]|uniref:uncharacterized protein LOC107357303 isoform X3 n=1 Tax=Acropora digitifera TaxID=70779 RepID=UPI00077A3794|nr:PREDICTED: uncharacterized protein LOC107357303 isoform X3 [Acropora digitifera]
MNYLPAPLPPPGSPESLGNCKLDSSFSSRNVITNAAYDYVDSDYGSTGYGNDYEELPNVRNEAKATSVPRKKTNDLYESPQSHRKRQITECSDDSIPSAMSTEIIQVKRDTCLNKLILFLILAVSVAALVLVILVILNIIGPKCSCSQGNAMTPGNQPIHEPRTAKMTAGQSPEDMIAHLKKRLSAMKVKMETRQRVVDIFVTNYEKQIKILNAHVSAQGRRINETANKVAAVDGVWMNMSNTRKAFESKLDSEFRLINKSMKTLSDSDTDLAALINELKVNQTITDGMRKRLSVNVSQIELRVQELRNSSNNVKRRVEKLKRGYAHVNASILALESKAVTQNASYNNLRYLYDNLAGSLSTVNSTYHHSKIVGAPPRQGFKDCLHKKVDGTPGTVTLGVAYSSADYKTPTFKQAVGVTCSTDYAAHVRLGSRSPGLYNCECRNVSPVFTPPIRKKMRCFLHVWECPA